MLQRNPLREDIRLELVYRLVRGELPAGTSINEVALSQEFGVSRTPLREALVSLELDGLIEARPRRGWWVPPLTPKVAREVYPIISALEVLALELTAPEVLRAQLPALVELNETMRTASLDPVAAQRADDAWHDHLLSACPNGRLLDMIRTVKVVVHRYEYAYLNDERSVPVSVTQHAAIITAIEDGRLADATSALRSNWTHGMEVLLGWLGSDGEHA